jgi:hypothetical protein
MFPFELLSSEASATNLLLKNDVPKQVVADRADVVDKHYNQMTKEEKMNKRRGYLKGRLDQSSVTLSEYISPK